MEKRAKYFNIGYIKPNQTLTDKRDAKRNGKAISAFLWLLENVLPA